MCIRDSYYALCDHQEQHRRAELDSGQCLTDAHKDDVLIDIDGQSARAFASQGQTRTAALSHKLAEREIFHDEFEYVYKRQGQAWTLRIMSANGS